MLRVPVLKPRVDSLAAEYALLSKLYMPALIVLSPDTKRDPLRPVKCCLLNRRLAATPDQYCTMSDAWLPSDPARQWCTALASAAWRASDTGPGAGLSRFRQACGPSSSARDLSRADTLCSRDTAEPVLNRLPPDIVDDTPRGMPGALSRYVSWSRRVYELWDMLGMRLGPGSRMLP